MAPTAKELRLSVQLKVHEQMHAQIVILRFLQKDWIEEHCTLLVTVNVLAANILGAAATDGQWRYSHIASKQPACPLGSPQSSWNGLQTRNRHPFDSKQIFCYLF